MPKTTLSIGDNLTVYSIDPADGSCIVVDDDGQKWELCYDHCDPDQIKIIAYVEGGVVQAARANVPASRIDFTVHDHDDLASECTDEQIEAADDLYEALEFGVY